jgi:hypothetical protein
MQVETPVSVVKEDHRRENVVNTTFDSILSSFTSDKSGTSVLTADAPVSAPAPAPASAAKVLKDDFWSMLTRQKPTATTSPLLLSSVPEEPVAVDGDGEMSDVDSDGDLVMTDYAVDLSSPSAPTLQMPKMEAGFDFGFGWELGDGIDDVVEKMRGSVMKAS